MTLDINALLAPVSADSPAGEDLSSSDDFRDIEAVFNHPDKYDENGNLKPRVVDWDKVLDQTCKLLAETKDLWLAVFLCKAGAGAGRLAVVVSGLAVIAALLETYWEDLYPRLEDDSAELRLSACDSLGVRRGFLLPLEKVVIFRHERFGVFNAEDIRQLSSLGSDHVDYIAFQDTLTTLEHAPLIEANRQIDEAIVHLRRVNEILAERAGETADIEPAVEAFKRLRSILAPFTLPKVDTEPVEEELKSSVSENSDNVGASGSSQRVASGAATTREDVIRLLDQICDYYNRVEPSSPVPFLMKRARAWVTMSFLDILHDISKEGLSEAQKILTTREKN